MTTLAANTARAWDLGDHNHMPVIASDIIYQGAAVGDNASGYARPLVSGDRFRGFALENCDNADGSAGDLNVKLIVKGKLQLSVTSLAITDIGRPVYASDDNAFALAGIGSYIGHVHRYISSGVGIVTFDADIPEEETVLSIPIILAGVTAADVVTTFTPGFAGRIKSLDFAVTDPVTTAAKLGTLNAEIGTTNLTGGAVALTSANCATLGSIIADTAITAAAGFKDTDSISIEAATVTAFVEGQGVLLVTLGK